MGFANVRSENTVRSSNHRLNYKIENLHTDVAYCCIIATTTKLDHVSLFLESKKTFLIRLHSSTIVYTRLVTHLHSSSDFVKKGVGADTAWVSISKPKQLIKFFI